LGAFAVGAGGMLIYQLGFEKDEKKDEPKE
jgi:hypothetical protein